jgi:hypothetical protein
LTSLFICLICSLDLGFCKCIENKQTHKNQCKVDKRPFWAGKRAGTRSALIPFSVGGWVGWESGYVACDETGSGLCHSEWGNLHQIH